MSATVEALKAELAAARKELESYKRHHAVCRIGRQRAMSTYPSSSADFTAEVTTALTSAIVKAAPGGKRDRSPFSHSEQSLVPRKRKPPTTIASMIQEIEHSPVNYADLQRSFMFLAVTSANLKQRATEMAGKLNRAKISQIVEDRIEVFLFFSCIVALQQTERLRNAELEETMRLALPHASGAYAKRILAGVRWMHQNVIRPMLDLGWQLEEATAVVARYAPRTPSGLREIQNEGQLQEPLVAKLHSTKSAGVAPLLWSVPKEMTKLDPSLSFKQVCKAMGYLTPTQGKVFSMLHLCTVIECPISRSLLKAAGQLRNRWSSDGSIEQFNATELGLDPDIVTALQEPRDVDSLLGYYKALGLIKDCCSKESSELNIVSQVDFTAGSSRMRPVHWNRIMVLACFFFTGCCEYYSNVRENSVRALPLFRELVKRSIGFGEHGPTSIIMRALLQASKFADNGWKSFSIEVAKTTRLEEITTEDRAYLAYRESFVLRSQGREKEAQLVIEEILKALPPRREFGPLLNAIYGLLLSSLSWTYVAQVQFEKAIVACSSWITGTSLYEMRADQKLVTARGIASKHLGKLDDAIHDLNAVLDASNISRARLYVLANLSDAYCENGQFEVAYSMLKSAAEEVGCLTSTPVQDTYHRTLLLSLSEVCSCLRRYEESNAILLRLKDYFELGLCIARNDQQRHIRVLLLLAQNKHRQATGLAAWLETQNLWRESISLTTKYQVLSTSGWDYAVMCLSLHHALRTVLHEDEGDAWLRKAIDIFLSGVEDHFWMRSLPTNWIPYILKQDLGITDDLRSHILTCRRM